MVVIEWPTEFGVFEEAVVAMFDLEVQFGVLGVLLAECQQLVEQWVIRRVSEVFRKRVEPHV